MAYGNSGGFDLFSMPAKKLKDFERLDRMAAKVDEDGNIIVAIRGPGVLSEQGMMPGKWVRLEEDVRAIEATVLERQAKIRVGANKRVGEKPVVRIEVDKTTIIAGKEVALAKIVPLTRGVPKTLKVQVNGQSMEVALEEEFTVESDVPQRLTIAVMDRRVNVSNRVQVIIARSERNERV